MANGWWWASAGVIGLLLLCLCQATTTPAAPIVAGNHLGPELAGLESEVGAHPDDAGALETLVDAYLARGAAGLAQAAIDRAPPRIRAMPVITDARARALAALGLPRVALEVEKSVLDRCEKRSCSRSLTGRAKLRSEWLEELVRLGVTDPQEQPEIALLAYRRSVREVRLDVR